MAEILYGLTITAAFCWLLWWHDRHGPDKGDTK